MNRSNIGIILLIAIVSICSIVTFIVITITRPPPQSYTITAKIIDVSSGYDTRYVSFSNGEVLRIWSKNAPVFEYYLNKNVQLEYSFDNQDIIKILNLTLVEGDKTT